ncbi:uncharacterized protein LOC135847641 [Planococcus citri]|uniref:uncharacterized protein LOC135847641 n=1 Tax=Planococcus citri TaxID=170843 RepID=UPI0031F7D456
MMRIEFFYVIIVLCAVIPSYVTKVIPRESLKDLWSPLEKDDDVWDKTAIDVDDGDNQGDIPNTDTSSHGKVKKHKKNLPRPSITDIRFPDRPDLVLLTFPSEFMDGEREKLLHMVDTKFGHLIDANVLKKVANGDMEAAPNVWNYLSGFDVKGALTSLLAQQFFKNFAAADEHRVETDVTREECKKICKDKEIELIQLINEALIRLTQTETKEGEDVRIRLRPGVKKCFKYEAHQDKHSTCTCLSVTKTIYVSPQLQGIINEKFFNSSEGEKEIEKLIEYTIIPEKPADENNNSGWSLKKLGHMALNSIGYGSEKTRAREPKRYDKHWFASKTEWILLNAVINILILGFCFPLWPFHVLFFLIGWFFV